MVVSHVQGTETFMETLFRLQQPVYLLFAEEVFEPRMDTNDHELRGKIVNGDHKDTKYTKEKQGSSQPELFEH